MFKRRIHVFPMADGRWGVRERWGYEALWHDLRAYGLGVMLYNLRCLMFGIPPCG